jgi:hypothetical protein
MIVKLGLLTAALILSTSAYAQDAPKAATAGSKSAAQIRPKAPMGCTLVGTVKGTKLWAGDCAAPDQLRSSVPATENSEPPLQDRANGAIPPGQK